MNGVPFSPASLALLSPFGRWLRRAAVTGMLLTPLVILIEGGYLVAELGNATVAFLEGALGSQPPQP